MEIDFENLNLEEKQHVIYYDTNETENNKMNIKINNNDNLCYNENCYDVDKIITGLDNINYEISDLKNKIAELNMEIKTINDEIYEAENFNNKYDNDFNGYYDDEKYFSQHNNTNESDNNENDNDDDIIGLDDVISGLNNLQMINLEHGPYICKISNIGNMCELNKMTNEQTHIIEIADKLILFLGTYLIEMCGNDFNNIRAISYQALTSEMFQSVETSFQNNEEPIICIYNIYSLFFDGCDMKDYTVSLKYFTTILNNFGNYIFKNCYDYVIKSYLIPYQNNIQNNSHNNIFVPFIIDADTVHNSLLNNINTNYTIKLIIRSDSNINYSKWL